MQDFINLAHFYVNWKDNKMAKNSGDWVTAGIVAAKMGFDLFKNLKGTFFDNNSSSESNLEALEHSSSYSANGRVSELEHRNYKLEQKNIELECEIIEYIIKMILYRDIISRLEIEVSQASFFTKFFRLFNRKTYLIENIDEFSETTHRIAQGIYGLYKELKESAETYKVDLSKVDNDMKILVDTFALDDIK